MTSEKLSFPKRNKKSTNLLFFPKKQKMPVQIKSQITYFSCEGNKKCVSRDFLKAKKVKKRPKQKGLLFVPIKVDPSASDDGPRFVDVIDLYDAVEVSDSSRPTSGPQASARQKVKAQHAAQPDGTGLGITLRFILDEV